MSPRGRVHAEGQPEEADQGTHKKEKAGKSKYRLHAALLRREGKSVRKISRMLGVAYSTVRDRLVRMHAGNLKRRFDRRRRGRARTIPRQIHRNIKRWLGRDPSNYGYDERIPADGHDPGHVVQEIQNTPQGGHAQAYPQEDQVLVPQAQASPVQLGHA